ncbi:MAG: DUF2357 domain-containing protein [Clostridia bacterium]|nr:DUF2357 domain-containing protein [Clostridia bacterium]
MEFESRFDLIKDLFKDDALFKSSVKDDLLGEWKIYHNSSTKTIDDVWLTAIEDALPHLDTIVRNPRRFIVVEEDLVDTSRARSVTEESVKHLATHTNFIHGIDKERDMILPSKLLNSTKEESFEVYENRFIYTLLKNLQMFIQKRYDGILGLATQNEYIRLVVDKTTRFAEANVSLKMDSVVKLPYDKAVKKVTSESASLERLTKIYNVVNGFMATPFAREMVRSAPVRPPIQRTNVILKNQDFKKALALWEFLQNYREDGFEVVPTAFSDDMSNDVKNNYRILVFLNNLFSQSFSGIKLEKLIEKRVKDEDGNKPLNPEDYPQIEVPVSEVRFISVPTMFTNNALSDASRDEVNSAIDRAFAQYKINTEDETPEEKEKRIKNQKLAEVAYKTKAFQNHKKERDLLAKEERRKKREQLRHDADIQEVKFEREMRAQLKKLEEENRARIEAEIDAVCARMDEDGIMEGIEQGYEDFEKENLTKIAGKIDSLNEIRERLKTEILDGIDEKIDAIIKAVPKIYEVEDED